MRLASYLIRRAAPDLLAFAVLARLTALIVWGI